MKKFFVHLGRVEGVSFLLILFVTMPLKYFFENPMPNKIVGMVHGLLFILYVFIASLVAMDEKWPRKVKWLAYLASVVPFGTFVFESKYLHSKSQD